jgi:type IV pilus assembly protein PilC
MRIVPSRPLTVAPVQHQNGALGTSFAEGVAGGAFASSTLQPSTLTAVGPTPGEHWITRHLIYPIWTGVSLKDMAVFYRQFSAMIGAGVPIYRTLEVLRGQVPAGVLRKALHRISGRVEAGESISGALSEFPYLFPPLQRAMIAAGEETGNLDVMLVRIAEYLERDFNLRNMIKRETLQPKLTLVLSFLLPPLFIAVMHGVQAYLTAVVLPMVEIAIAALGFYIAGRFALQSATVAYAYDTIKAFIPYFGKTVRMLAIAKFSRAFAAMYAAGVPIPHGLMTSAEVGGNRYLAAAIGRARTAIQGGASLTDALRGTGVFPDTFLAMVGTGEVTGGLDLTLTKLADFFEDEAAVRLHQSVIALNTLFFLGVAAWVGYEVVTFYEGLYNGGEMKSLLNSN